MVAVHKATGKAHNKKLRRRRDGLSTKCFEYGELDGAEQALFIRYPKRGEFYAHVSRRGLPWLQDVPVMMSHAKARVEYPEDLRARVEDARRKVRTARDTNALAAGDASKQNAQVGPERVHLASFPDFECNLTVLRKRLGGERRVVASSTTPILSG